MKIRVDIPVYGVPINTREALGVLHFKGFIIDDCVLYSGASLNDVYLHQHDKYRYDRYQCIRNGKMADIMFDWVDNNLVQGAALTVSTDRIGQKARKSKTTFASTVRSSATAATILSAPLVTKNSPSPRW